MVMGVRVSGRHPLGHCHMTGVGVDGIRLLPGLGQPRLRYQQQTSKP